MIGLINRLMHQQRRPSKKIRDTVVAVLTDLGIGEEFMVDEFADAVATRVASYRSNTEGRMQLRIDELQDYNTEQVLRRRAAFQAMRGIIAYAEEYAPETVPAFKAILSANNVTL